MRAVLRSWLGFIALGAGLIHFALLIGSPLPVALVLLLVGAAEFVWGVFTFVRPTPPVPMLARSGALVPVIGWALLLVVAGADSFGPLTSTGEIMPMVVASLFDLLIAGILTGLLRREGPGERSVTRRGVPDADAGAANQAPALPAAGYLVAVLGGALLIAAITTPALAATEASTYGKPPVSSTSGYDFNGSHNH